MQLDDKNLNSNIQQVSKYEGYNEILTFYQKEPSFCAITTLL